MLDEDFIGHIFPQNCGDSLLVIEKSNKKDNGGNYLYRCQFQKYFYEVFVRKGHILNGSIINPQIEKVEFIDKIWPQKCGDSLKIISKYEKGDYWNVEFINYPYKLIARKIFIKEGTVLNPEIENQTFIGKEFPQNCGDSLVVLEKTNKQDKDKSFFYRCQFQKYPYEILTSNKKLIKEGNICNPLIEQNEFIGHIYNQQYGEKLKVIEKTSFKKDEHYLYKCQFKNYPYETLAKKEKILKGHVLNPKLPHLNKNTLLQYIKDNFEEKPTLQELADSLNLAYTTIGQKIIEFDLKEYISYFDIKSTKEFDLRNYIYSLNDSFLKESCWTELDGKEIDIYSPSLKLGIEYNGNYWHSELYKSPNYHQEKSLLAKEKGIQLVHIFEYEWINKQEILESLIKSKLGIFEKKIPARKCIIKELQNKEYQDFCNKNHLQGECGAKVKLGLFYKDELIQVMSFGVPRFTNKYEWEIIRECSKLGYIILGGKERLWKYFVKNYNPKDCISYCDFSKFTGNSYLKLGFEKISLNLPGFVWWDKESNQIFQRSPWKHKEMKEKYIRIFDAGQLVFKWTNFKVYLQII